MKIFALPAVMMFCTTSLFAQVPLGRLQSAIDAGMAFPNRAKYLEKGAEGNKCNWAGTFAMDGISKEVRIFTDFDVVASAAAAANAEMRKFTTDDALKLPLHNVVFANVNMTARGIIPVQRLKDKYVQKGVHMVIQLGDSIVQPLTKESVTTDGSTVELGTLYQWYHLGGMSLLTGVPLGWSSQKFQQEFVFPVSASDVPRDLTVYVIDNDGKRSKISCDLKALRIL
jgi:hypothetical protein